MIRPIGIENADLRHGRISLLVILEIILDVLEILKGHCKTKGIIQLTQILLRHVLEAVKDGNVCRIIKYRDQGVRLLHASLSGVYGVDAICLNL